MEYWIVSRHNNDTRLRYAKASDCDGPSKPHGTASNCGLSYRNFYIADSPRKCGRNTSIQVFKFSRSSRPSALLIVSCGSLFAAQWLHVLNCAGQLIASGMFAATCKPPREFPTCSAHGAARIFVCAQLSFWFLAWLSRLYWVILLTIYLTIDIRRVCIVSEKINCIFWLKCPRTGLLAAF